jgi:lipoate-protein ligase A
MNKWRLLDTGILTAAKNIAMNETLLEAKKNRNTPNTVRFLQFFPPAVLLGYHQSLEQEIRVDFCKKAVIDINRRITGGGCIYFYETQLGWEIICEKKNLI